MTKITLKIPVATILSVTILAIIYSSLTLWLVDSWIKYPLFLFELFTIIVIYLIVNGYGVKLKLAVRRIQVKVFNLGSLLGVLLALSASALLIIKILGTQGGIIQLMLALLVTSLLPGYALLDVFGFTKYFSKLEMLVLSCVISYIYTGLLTIVLLPINVDARILIALANLAALGLILFLKNLKNKTFLTKASLSRDIDILALCILIVFYTISFSFVYPGFSLRRGTDALYHYAQSIILSRTPDLYIAIPYLLAHLHEAMLIMLSTQSPVFIQVALLTLNLLLPLSFYIMAKTYLEEIDARLPSLATLFWSLFTNSFGGFAWLYFACLKISAADQTQLRLLVDTSDKTYYGTIYGILGLWYVPLTASFIILMIVFSLIRNREIPTFKFMALFSALITALYLTHIVEGIVFTVFLALYGISISDEDLRVDESIKSSIMGSLTAIGIYFIFLLINPHLVSYISLSFWLALIAPIFLLPASLILKRYSGHKRLCITCKNLSRLLPPLLFYLYVVSSLSCISLIHSFHTWQVSEIGLVPYFMYPLILGVNGLLSILALFYIIDDKRSYNALKPFLVFAAYTFIVGKLVSMINLHFFDIAYSEKRFILFLKIPLAMLAPLPVIYNIDNMKKNIDIGINTKACASLIIIGTIVLWGISTTYLNLEFWNRVANDPTRLPSQSELEAITALRDIFNKDPRAWLVTVTSTSSATVRMAATPTDPFGLWQLLYTARTPEMAFTRLYMPAPYSHPYVYLHSRDTIYLNKFSDSFLRWYITMLPVVFKNPEVTIYNVSRVSFPQPSNEIALIVPFDEAMNTEGIKIAYCILSQGLYRYSVAYDLDDKALNFNTIILAFDLPKRSILSMIFKDEFNKTLGSWIISKGYWRIEGGKLIAGEDGKISEGLILSPVLAQNFTANFKVKPLKGVALLNYVSFIYSYIDPKNYRIADILFNKEDGFIYVHFRTVVNGVEKVIPKWPGVKTELRWEFGKEYNITVNVVGDLNQIFIDNKLVLSVNLNNIPGRVGLRYFRFYKVAFDDFLISYTVRLYLRPTNDYLNYLESGGRIIVLNTNGYGSFANMLFLRQNLTAKVDRIEGPTLKATLPTVVQVSNLVPKAGTLTLSYYVGKEGRIPFILRKNIGSGELIYVNLYPIVRAIVYKPDIRSAFYALLGKILDDLNLPRQSLNLMPNFDAYVKEVRCNNVEIETASLLFPLKVKLNVIVETKNGSYDFQNVTSIVMTGYPRAIIKTNSVVLGDGKGFYTTLKINSTFIIEFPKGLTILKIVTGDEEFKLDHVTRLSITPTNFIRLLARTPVVSSSEAYFTELYLRYGFIRWRARTFGQDLEVLGLVRFSVVLSDSYSALDDIKLTGSFQRYPPRVIFDELSTLSTAAFWALLSLPVLFYSLHNFTFRKLKIKSKSGWEEDASEYLDASRS